MLDETSVKHSLKSIANRKRKTINVLCIKHYYLMTHFHQVSYDNKSQGFRGGI